MLCIKNGTIIGPDGREKADLYVENGRIAAVGGTLPYGVGDRVRHVKFGEGTVLDIKEGSRDKEVTVEFDTVGVRKMFAMFAKLVKVG